MTKDSVVETNRKISDSADTESLVSAQLPKKLLEGKVSTKLLYLFLEHQEYVEYSQTELAQILGISRQSVNTAIDELEDMKLFEYKHKPQNTRERAIYKVLSK